MTQNADGAASCRGFWWWRDAEQRQWNLPEGEKLPQGPTQKGDRRMVWFALGDVTLRGTRVSKLDVETDQAEFSRPAKHKAVLSSFCLVRVTGDRGKVETE